MKRLINLLVIVLICVNGQAQEAKKYAVKSGYLKLELSGSTTGTKELWWDDYGNNTCELEKSTTTTKMFGIKDVTKKHMLTILVKDRYWVVDYIENTGTKGTVPFYQEGKDMVEGMSEQEQKDFADEFLAQLGGEKQGTEKINGYTCDVFKVMGAKTWIYKGIALKSQAKVLGIKNNEMFTVFKPNTSVPSSKFKAPGNFNYQDLNAAQQDYFGGLGDYEEEDDDEMAPVNYPFEKFQKVIDGFSYSDYNCRGTNSRGGIHAATFTKGMNSIMIMAESRKNTEKGEMDTYEQFNHNGHRCYYGEIEDEDGSAIVVDYPSYDMHVIIAALPEMTKQQLLQITNKLKF